jgi:hypothetical protein
MVAAHQACATYRWRLLLTEVEAVFGAGAEEAGGCCKAPTVDVLGMEWNAIECNERDWRMCRAKRGYYSVRCDIVVLKAHTIRQW